MQECLVKTPVSKDNFVDVSAFEKTTYFIEILASEQIYKTKIIKKL